MVFTFISSICLRKYAEKSRGQINRKNTMHHRQTAKSKSHFLRGDFFCSLFFLLFFFFWLVTCLLYNSAAAFVCIVDTVRVHRSSYQPNESIVYENNNKISLTFNAMFAWANHIDSNYLILILFAVVSGRFQIALILCLKGVFVCVCERALSLCTNL